MNGKVLLLVKVEKECRHLLNDGDRLDHNYSREESAGGILVRHLDGEALF